MEMTRGKASGAPEKSIMIRRTAALVGVLFALFATAYAAPEDPQAEQAEPLFDEEDEIEGFLESSPRWREMRDRLQSAVDADGLLRARRWGNVANGALLAATGPIALTVSLFGFKLSNVVLSLYVTIFGGVLAGIELGIAPIAPWVSTNLGYLATSPGRTALLAFMGGLTWPLGRLGLIPAVLTCLNAMFNANFAQLLQFVSEDDAKPGSAKGGGLGADFGSVAADDGGAAAAAQEAAQRAELEAALEAAERAHAKEAELLAKKERKKAPPRMAAQTSKTAEAAPERPGGLDPLEGERMD